jgi:hypoxanthine phosphoribosyltransferase
MIEIRIEPLFSAEEIAQRIRELGRRLDRELPADPVIVSLLGGSVIFLADLLRAIERPVRYELVHVETSGGGDAPLALHYPIPFEVRGENVLLLKDVVTSGVTETYLMEQLRDQGAREVRLAALVDMPGERKTDLEVAYGALTAKRPGRLVGYGLKHQGQHGNLPYIGRLAAA